MSKYIKTSFINFLNENIEEQEEEYQIFNGDIERIENIPEDIKINDYIKSDLINRKGEYYYENDRNRLVKVNIQFEGDDIIILNDKKYKLSKDTIAPSESYFDLRFADEISTLSDKAHGIKVPFGFRQHLSNNKGSKWVDGNDCFFKAVLIK